MSLRAAGLRKTAFVHEQERFQDTCETIEEVKMRGISLLIAGAVLSSCTMSAQEPAPSVRAQTKTQQLLAGRVAQAPISCLPTLKANNMEVIDENTIAFRDGTRVYINHPEGGCPQANQGHTALVTRQFAQTGPCRGDVVQVVDTLNRMTVGSCALGDFIPYVRQGA
jgi:hypothetical protein